MQTTLNLRRCPKTVLNNLPENMEMRGNLGLVWCEEPLKSLPRSLKVGGELNLNSCYFLESLPEGLKVGGELNLYECKKLKSLPEGLKVGGNIRIDRSGIDTKRVPEHLKGKLF